MTTLTVFKMGGRLKTTFNANLGFYHVRGG